MERVCNGVIRVPISFVNAYLVGTGERWVLIDSGLPGFAAKIRRAAAEAFGTDSKPKAIVLTHGHFDHSGSAGSLARTWEVPVYAHKLELPYLTGKSKYPAPDPTIGGAIGFLSRFMPTSGMNLRSFIKPLDEGSGEGGVLPGLDDWRWLATPGHSPGHISFYRDSDQTLLAGDALATMDMETAQGMIFKRPQLARAGAPFNHDWEKTANSVRKLADLNPRVIAAGHGLPLSGPQLPNDLRLFAERFPVPRHGRYATVSATANEQGVLWLPPKPYDPFPKQAATVSLIALAGLLLVRGLSRRR